MSPFRRLVAASATIVLAALVTVVPSGAAMAHEQLLESSPSEGERLDSAPAEVSLTFSSGVLTLGAVVLVVDGGGTNWVTSDARVDGSTVTVDLDPGMPEGGYEVRWRVVSGDGHPISDIIPFTVGDAAPLVRTTASPAPTAENTSADVTEEHNALWRTVLVAAIGALVAGGLFALISLGRRRARRTHDHARR